MRKLSCPVLITLLVVLLVVVFFIALCAGRYSIRVTEVVRILASSVFDVTQTWDDRAYGVIFTLRLPRTIGAVLVGAALSLAGAAYQGVFKNPLVSPDLLGVSSGACVGAAIAILLGMNSLGVQTLAFAVGIGAVTLTMLIPRLFRSSSMMMLVLSGVIVRGMMDSVVGVIKYIADPETQLADITYWTLGSLVKVLSSDLFAIAPVIAAGCLMVLLLSWRINILSLGEQEARALGVHVGFVRGVVIICSTLLTASAVCVCGTIGWVGLVIPHLSRITVGQDNTKSIPVSLLMGAIFMVAIDTLARVLTSLELPLSILTGIIGAPFYFMVLAGQRMSLS
ncbi:iron ABC transporter permease [uncultured Fretibacterium sp.]|uniref:FecCD family ABC transporter permease n=1 Tax=uncultured Fretibacterium sp. TaxID=1678694 RepID=UPI0026102EDE|nr:iron ABC transporter permease [uncultured Fretibacterium sp.]